MSYTRADYQSAREKAGVLALSRTQPGTSKELCPLCEGGSSRERSLSLTVADDGVSWAAFCHRASCKFFSRGGRPGAPAELPRPAFEERPYRGDTQAIGAETHPYWMGKLRRAMGPNWPRRAEQAGFLQAADDPRELLFPLRTVFGSRRGYISRRWNEDGTRTVRTWRERPGPVYSVYDGSLFQRETAAPAEVWLVEDHLSAARLAIDVYRPAATAGVALCGTHVLGELVRELRPLWLRAERVYVALDPDAATQGIETALWLRNEYGLDAWPVLLPADIKDLSAAEYGRLREARTA